MSLTGLERQAAATITRCLRACQQHPGHTLALDMTGIAARPYLDGDPFEIGLNVGDDLTYELGWRAANCWKLTDTERLAFLADADVEMPHDAYVLEGRR